MKTFNLNLIKSQGSLLAGRNFIWEIKSFFEEKYLESRN